MANPTTNYGFVLPTPTDLVTDLPADFDVALQGVDTQMLTNANAAIAKTIVDAKGDIIAATGADAVSRLAVGANATILTADSTTATGLKWAAASSSGGQGVAVVLGSSQSIPDNTDTFINWQTEVFDTDGFHDNVNQSRFTVPAGKAGKYLFAGTVQFAGNATGTRNASIGKNGAVGGSRLAIFSAPAYGSSELNINFYYVADLEVGDYLGVAVKQNSGAALNVFGNSSNTSASTASFMYLGA